MRRALVLGASAALLVAAPASGAQVEIKGNDALTWDTPFVTVATGDSVVWSFAGTTQLHNVAANSPNWQYASPLAAPAPSGSFTFAAPGVYAFICQVHSGMTGAVTVAGTDGTLPPDAIPPGPPVVPPSQQSLPSDMPDAGPLEVGGFDTTRPALRNVAARRSGRRVKVSFRVSEQSVVTVRLARGGKTVKTKQVRTARSGAVAVRGLKAGRYTASVKATDLAGNASRSRSASFSIR